MNAVTAEPPAVPATSPQALRDFHDFLSPMLVKELRQGTRAPLFIWSLIVMNLLLTVVVWLMALSPDDNGLANVFWYTITGVVCGVLPLRASNALHDELRGGTIDTLVLTRLTGWRIALGKWVAVAAQQVLTMVTVMPYLLVRYFTGGVNVGQELLWLAAFLVLGVAVAGILAGFSWLPHFLLRAALMIAVLWGGGALVSELIEHGVQDADFWRNGWERMGWRGMLVLLLAVSHAVFFALDTGAGRAGSKVENRSALRRLVGIGALCVYGGMLWWAQSVTALASGYSTFPSAVVVMRMAVVFGILTAMVLVVQAMAENPVPLAPVAEPFVRRGRIGRLAGKFLYPGWPSGVWFSFLIAMAFFGLGIWSFLDSYWSVHWDTGWSLSRALRGNSLAELLLMLAVLGTLAVPPVLYHLVFKRWLPWNAAVYVLFLALALAAHLIIATSADGLDSAAVYYPGMLLPSMGATAAGNLAEDAGPEMLLIRPEAYLNLTRETVLAITALVTAAWWTAALLLGLRGMREMTVVEEEAAAALKKPAKGAEGG